MLAKQMSSHLILPNKNYGLVNIFYYAYTNKRLVYNLEDFNCNTSYN